MTTINNQDDFLEALRNNPQWRDAVRAQILGDDLMELPAKFDAFVEEQKAHNEKLDAFVEEQGTTHANLDARLDRIDTRLDRMDTRLERMDTRLERMEGDTGTLKGDFARTRTVQDAQGIASDMGLEFIRTLSAADLSEVAGNALPRDVGRSFRNADLGDRSDGREQYPVHSDGGLLHRGPEGLRPGHPERRAYHPVHRQAGAGRRRQRQKRPRGGGGSGVRGGVLAPAGGPDAESRVTPKNHSGAPANRAIAS